MKKFKGSLGVKLCAMFLFVVFTAVSAVGVCAIIFSAAQNIYIDEGKGLSEKVLYELTYRKLYSLRDHVQTAFSPDDMTLDEELIPDSFSEENTNLSFRITDGNKNVLYENSTVEDFIYMGSVRFSADLDYSPYTQVFDTLEAADSYANDYYLANPESKISIRIQEDAYGNIYYVFIDEIDGDGKVYYNLEGYVRTDLSVKDEFYTAVRLIDIFVQSRYVVIIVTAASILLTVLLFIFLLCCAGHKIGIAEIHLCWYDRIPFDILLLALFCLSYFNLCVIDYFDHSDVSVVIAIAVSALVWLPILMGTLMSFSARAKAGAWWKNTLIYAALHFVWKLTVKVVSLVIFIIKSIPLIWKFVLFWIAISLVEFAILAFFIYRFDEMFIPYWISYKTLATALYAVCAVNLVRLKRAGERLAGGDLAHRPDSRYMFGDFASHAKNLGSISDGIQLAVDRQLKSERMKTELIANVSHDIKTPLTSIINYVDLLKKEDIESEKAKEYIRVIDKHSARLKKLTEDLVEASKAQTGNVNVNFEPCDAGVLVSQAYGEYEDKMREIGLVPILEIPKESSYIYADGKLLWRVFDNLFGNICKYAMTGTRVFVTVEASGEKVTITFRNISATPLEISGAELTERFVRGDKSRNSEGSGLGLSISKSLTELMGGAFGIIVDGDLFKAVIEFSQLK